MASSILDDKSIKPTANQLRKVLGRMKKLWDELRDSIAEHHGPVSEEWVHAGKNYGWSLRLKRKKRAILYMTPCDGFFRVAFAFGEKAVEAAHESNLPVSALNLVDNAPKYPEGRGVRMEIKNRKDIRIAETLAAIKMAN